MDAQGGVLAEYLILPKERNFNGFMPTAHALIESSGTEIERIQTIVVTIGPGSFTGMRVGLAMAKGMAQGLRIPIIGVSGLETLATQVPYANHPVRPIIDSRKGEVFTALFYWDDNRKMVRTQEDTCVRIEDLSSLFKEKTVVLGNDFNSQVRILKETNAKVDLAPAHLWNLKASVVGTLGLKRFLARDFDNPQDLAPAYLRPPDIRPNPYPSQSIRTKESS
jgi:tRNA threonylcarbamoyladenosine biosynthesis protein TsaB